LTGRGASSTNATKHVRHRRRFPFPAPRRRNAPSVQGGGGLSERLRPSGLSLGDGGRDSGSERIGSGCADRVDGGAGLGEALSTATIIASPRTAATTGAFAELSELTSLKTFVS
jgi:hypothetical protein